MSKAPSIHGELGATVFTDGHGYDFVYPWKSKSEYPDALMKLIHQAGVPKTLVTDGTKEMMQGEGRAIASEYRMGLKVTVPYSPWQNLAEACIREL